MLPHSLDKLLSTFIVCAAMGLGLLGVAAYADGHSGQWTVLAVLGLTYALGMLVSCSKREVTALQVVSTLGLAVVVAVAALSVLSNLDEHWLLGSALLLALLWLGGAYRKWRQQQGNDLAEMGHCPHCGYDLRASEARCPECGEDLPESLARRRRIRSGARRVEPSPD